MHGRILGDASGPPQEPFVEIVSEHSKRYTARITGDRYEAWLPAKSFPWLLVGVHGTCRDGRLANLLIAPSSLHDALKRGADLQFQRPTRSVTFRYNMPANLSQARTSGSAAVRQYGPSRR